MIPRKIKYKTSETSVPIVGTKVQETPKIIEAIVLALE